MSEERTTKMIVCNRCRGEGKVAHLAVETMKAITVAQLYDMGRTIPYEYRTCPRCQGDRVVRRVKTITYERVKEKS